MAISDYNASAALNTSISGINIAENMPAANVNNAFRQMMADLKTQDTSLQASLLAGIAPISLYGSLAAGSAAKATVEAAANAVTPGLAVADDEANTGTTGYTNPGGSILGLAVYHDAADGKGGIVDNKRHPFHLAFGLECLTLILNKIRLGTASKIYLIGDSNGSSWFGPTLANLLAGLPGVVVTNACVSGSTLGQWHANTAPVNGTGKDFTTVMAADPDLIIDLYGDTNGPYYGGTAASFAASKATVYSAIRAHANGGKTAMSLISVTPAPMRDGGAMSIEGGAKRDELHAARVRPYHIREAVKHSAAFFDLNSLLADTTVTDLDSNVHVQNSNADLAAHLLFEWMIPAVYRGGNSTYIGTKAAAALPATYADNVTMFRMEDGANDGFGVSLKPSFGATHQGLQFNWRYNVSAAQIAVRHAYNGTTWGAWGYLGQGDVVAVVAAAGYTVPATSSGANVRRDGGFVSAQGHVTMDTPGTIAAGVTLMTIPASHRPAVAVQGVILVCKEAGAVYDQIFATLNTDGTLVTRKATALTVAEVHISGSWRFA